MLPIAVATAVVVTVYARFVNLVFEGGKLDDEDED